MFHQLGNAYMRPIDLRLVDEFRYEIASLAQREMRHALGVGLLIGPLVSPRVLLSDDFHKLAGRGDTR